MLQLKPHWPLIHVGDAFAGALHTVPHPPQFEASVCVLTHALPHLLKPALHPKSHWPALQIGYPFGGGEQTVPQPPQLEVETCVSTHEPLQFLSVVPGQLVPQVPMPEHTRPAAHGLLQPPQFKGSDSTSTHELPHSV